MKTSHSQKKGKIVQEKWSGNTWEMLALTNILRKTSLRWETSIVEIWFSFFFFNILCWVCPGTIWPWATATELPSILMWAGPSLLRTQMEGWAGEGWRSLVTLTWIQHLHLSQEKYMVNDNQPELKELGAGSRGSAKGRLNGKCLCRTDCGSPVLSDFWNERWPGTSVVWKNSSCSLT